MTEQSDIHDAIDERGANGIKRVQVGNQSVELDPVDDQLKISRDKAARTAATKPHFGLRMTQLIPPGTG